MATTYTDRLKGTQTSVAIKAPAAVATTANITLSGLQTIDGITVASEDRVLVKDQTTATENGIWIASASAWERAIDFNGARDIAQGTRVFVNGGTAGGGRMYYVSTESPTIGTSSLSFTQEASETGQSVTTSSSPTFAALTLTGQLLLGASPTLATHAATMQYVDTTVAQSYGSRALAEAATVPSFINAIEVIHNGFALRYVRDATGTALTTAGSDTWSPSLNQISPLHWGANGDAATSDNSYITAMFLFAEGVSSGTVWRDSMGKTLGTPVTVTGLGATYAVSSQVDFEAGNSGIHIDALHLKAIAGTWETAGGTATTERELYRPHKSDFLLSSKANATFINITNCRWNANNLCGGVKLRSRSYVVNTYIAGCAGFGVHGASGDVWAIGCKVWQFTKQDVEFWDKDAYTGVGYFCGATDSASDMRVANCQAMWLHELVRFEDTNCNVWGGHFFNGPEDYLAADRGAFSAEEKTAVEAYYSIADADTYDFPVRTYHAGFVTSGESNLNSKDASFSNIYLDNCHNEFYFDRVKLEGIRYGAKSSASPSGTPDYWNRFYCHTNGAFPECMITAPQLLVETVTKQMYTFAANGGNTWGGTYATYEASAINNFSSDLAAGGWGDGLEMFKPRAFVCTEDFSDRGFPVLTFVGPNNDGLIGMADAGTTTDASGNPESILFGAKGDIGRIRARNGPVVIGNLSGAPTGAEANALTVSTGTSGVTSVGVGVDDVIIENNADAGMSILSPDANETQIALYDVTGKRGYIKSLANGDLELWSRSGLATLNGGAIGSAGGEVNPTQVTPTERTAGTETALRSFAPADVASMAVTHGGGGSVDVGTKTFASRADAKAWTDVNTPADGFMVSWPDAEIVAQSGATGISDFAGWVPRHYKAVPQIFGAAADGQSSPSGSISSASQTLAITGAFVSGDVGKAISVEGAGAAGVDLVTTISAFIDANSVTLTASAGTTVSGANVTWGTDDTNAIEEAYAWVNDGDKNVIYDDETRDIFTIGTKNTIHFPAGTYIYNGAGLAFTNQAGRNISLTGDETNATFIVNFADSYLFDLQATDPAPNSILVANATFMGGKGLYMNRNTTAIPQGYQTFEKVRVLGFSECGIASIYGDSPRWTFRDVQIETRKPSTKAIFCPPGIAHSKFYNTSIFGCTYGLVTANSFQSNSIISGITVFTITGTDHAADIWLQPVDTGVVTNANVGQGFMITGNRFSAENRDGKPVVLIADADGVGEYQAQNHSTSTSNNTFRDMIITGNVISGEGAADNPAGTTGPLVQSYTGNVGAIQIHGNSLNAAFTYLLQLEVAPTTGTASDAVLGPNMAQAAGSDHPVPCNLDFGRWYYGDGAEIPSSGTNLPSDGGYDHNFFLISTDATGNAANPSDWADGADADSTTVIVGPYGFGTGRQIEFASDGATAFVTVPSRNLTEFDAAQNGYFEFDVKASTGRPMAEFDVEITITHSGGGKVITRSVHPSALWQTIRVPFRANGTISVMTCRFIPSSDAFSAGVSDRVWIDNAVTYIANRPVNRKHLFAQDAAWNKGHVVMHESAGSDELHIHPDWTNQLLRADFAAPTAEDSGSIIPLMVNSGAGRFLTPTVYGSTTAGSATYAGGGQNAYFMEIGNFVVGFGYVNWSGHTGTGNMLIGLDYAPNARDSSAGNRGIFLVSAMVDMSTPSGSQICGYIERNTNFIVVRYRENTGDTALPLPTSGKLNFLFAYEKA